MPEILPINPFANPEATATLRRGLLDALAMLERYDSGTADAIRKECNEAIKDTFVAKEIEAAPLT